MQVPFVEQSSCCDPSQFSRLDLKPVKIMEFFCSQGCQSEMQDGISQSKMVSLSQGTGVGALVALPHSLS